MNEGASGQRKHHELLILVQQKHLPQIARHDNSIHSNVDAALVAHLDWANVDLHRFRATKPAGEAPARHRVSDHDASRHGIVLAEIVAAERKRSNAEKQEHTGGSEQSYELQR